MYKPILIKNLTKLLSLLNATSISKLPAEIKQNLTESEDLRYHLRKLNICKTAAR